MNPAGLVGAAYWLPLLSAGVIALAVAMYVVLDGFDLGIGILFPYFPSETERDQLMNSVAPFWDGNETWLVLGGTALLVSFPLAYAVILPAVYLPVILMLLGLVFRGVAFEFRWVAKPHHRRWDLAFAAGSTVAAFSQGLILGAVLAGIPVSGGAFSGGAFSWLTPFSLMCGCALIVGYALIGACWIAMKTSAAAEARARRQARGLLGLLLFFIVLVSIWTPLEFARVAQRWFSWPNIAYLSPVPAVTAALAITCWRALPGRHPTLAFYSAVGLFVVAFIGLMISTLPYLVPPVITLWQAAAAPRSQAFMLSGMALMIPVILGYTVFVYRTFSGKVRPGEGYH
ncbi:MAG TPA: cytochrome d ubiquinol oxidase subunit II [Steroidobacteraceae bacterium]|nr:cytochrome d ubiquinol oxidase subunit II [Steroidobacteraceae bacterium]